jgi:hypothetical protein
MSDKLQFVVAARQAKETPDQVPRSGCDLQPWVAAAATLGTEFLTVNFGLWMVNSTYKCNSRIRFRSRGARCL